MPLPSYYAYLADEPGPPQLSVALTLADLFERRSTDDPLLGAGSADDPIVGEFSAEISALFSGVDAGEASHSRVPWSGAAHAVCHARGGIAPPDGYLSALAWEDFGEPVDAPMLGDTIVQKRLDSEGEVISAHVSLYVGEDDGHYHALGANEMTSFNVTRIRKATPGLIFRRPPYDVTPDNVRAIEIVGPW